MVTATFTVFSISTLWVYTEVHNSKIKKAEIKEQYISEQRNLIKNEVKQVVSMIDFTRKINSEKSKSKLQKEILDYFSSIRLNYGGYIFINQYDGLALIFDGVKIIGDKNIKNLTDPDGLKIFETELNAIKNPDGGFFNYKFKRLNSTLPVPKISYVYGYNDWSWIIGAGIYLDDLNLIIQQEENRYQAVLFKKVLLIVMVFAFLMIILFIISTFISGFLKKELGAFMSFLTENPNDISGIDEKKLRIDEFRQIAHHANIVIDKQINTENLLIKERDKAHKYLDIADVIILILDTEGNVTLINRKGWEILGYDMQYIVGKNWFRYFVPLSEKELLSNNFLKVMSSNNELDIQNYESKIITSSGEERIITWHNTLLYADDGTINGSLSSGRDITKRRLAEKYFSESEEKYKLLFEKTSDPVLIIGESHTFIDCNNAALKLLRFLDKKELIGKHPDELSPKDQPDGTLSIVKASQMIAKAKLNSYLRFEWLHHDKFNKPFHVDVSLTVIPIEGVEYLHVIWRDISLKKEQDEKLIIAKEKAELGEDIKTSFLHNMQHEIRTPLNAIMGFSQLLKIGGQNQSEIVGYYDNIISSGNQLSKTIDEIIDFSRLQAGYILINNENTELKKLLSEIFKEYIPTIQIKSIKFTISECSSGNNTLVRTDVFRLKQIIGHLLNNAFKFTEEGGVDLGYTIIGNEIIFSVIDTGVGIEEKYLETIFDKFNRVTHKDPSKLYGGNGLGLSISKTVLNLLNGDIWVESEVNKGSKFTFTIPYKPIEINPKIQKETFDGSNITIVTNNKSNFRFISNILIDTQSKLIHVTNGMDAIELCQNNYITNLMVIDMDLYEMNAITTTKAIKAFNIHMPIIALCTDDCETNTKEDALAAGCDDYILTSQNNSEILLTLSLWLNQDIISNNNE